MDVLALLGGCCEVWVLAAGDKGASAPLDKGMQAHTCYDYTGGLLEDQSFDEALLNQRQFKIVYFLLAYSITAHPHLWIFQRKRRFSEKPFASGFGTVGSMG